MMKEATCLIAQEEVAMASVVIVPIVSPLVQCTARTAQALIMVARGALHMIGTVGPPMIGAGVLTMVSIEAERCAVCRWIEDWEYNKMIISNRCQVAVHQECYGARSVRDFTSWVCRACETPQQRQDCCFCPVKGGALKPTDVDSLWVHVTCAWFRPEATFSSEETMEHAIGILNIASKSFKKLHCSERNGRQIRKFILYCTDHGAPNPDNVLIVHTPNGVFSTKILLQNNDKQAFGRLINRQVFSRAILLVEHPEASSAMRCLIYRKAETKIIE